MDAATVRAERDRLVSEHGPWGAYNIRLAPGVFTMGNAHVGNAELLIHAVVQAVADLAGKPLAELRVLDLGCHEGGYSIELGLQGCRVVGIEGRPGSVAKARFAARCLGLGQVEFVQGDVRDGALLEAQGTFDVVLCLGILYHLEALDAVGLLRRCFDLGERLTVIRSAIGLRADVSAAVDGLRYEGRRYREDTRHRGASLDNPTSIFPSKTSLLNILGDLGFSSVHEVRNPPVPNLDDARDSVTLVAVHGSRVDHRSVPELNEVLPVRRPRRRGPEWLRAYAHPQQGLYWRVREGLFHSFSRRIFRSNRPVEAWRAEAERGVRR